MIDSFCENLAIDRHSSGTYIAIEGPQFSTKAESNLYRKWGCDIIGMTAIPEAKLAREAEMCYATIALVTDYDCWKVEEEPVTAEIVIGHLKANAEAAKEIIAAAVPRIPEVADWPEHRALSGAILTDPSLWPEKTKLKLEPIIGRFC